MSRMSGLGLLMLVLGSRALAAQDSRLAARLDPPTAAEVGALIANARAGGLPAEPLVDRALEGASKGATGSRIVVAVRALLRDLQAASLALGPGSVEPELVAGAGAIRAGTEGATLTRLRTVRPQNPLIVPLGVLADLVAWGVPADTAARAVLALASAGASDNDYLSLRRNVERDISAGLPPAIAASLRSRGMPTTLPPTFGPPGAVAAPAGADRERATVPTNTGNRP